MGNSKMNARERIDYLFDDHSFVEVGGYVPIFISLYF
jgi:methylmalonyl-CoA decarboxylase subunit alpha